MNPPFRGGFLIGKNMAYTPTNPMTVQDIMDEVYVNVDNDPTSSTDSTQDEWTSRLRLINQGIAEWQSQDVMWNELWTSYTVGTLSGSQTYSLAMTDFLMPGSLLYCTDTDGNIHFLDIVKPEEQIKYAIGPKKAAFITGNNQTGWTLNLTFVPADGDNFFGSTAKLYYYKSASRMAGSTDTPEMSDPSYLVHYVTAQKQLFNNRTDLAEQALAQAQMRMDNMRIRNETRVNYGDYTMDDADVVRYGDQFGGDVAIGY